MNNEDWGYLSRQLEPGAGIGNSEAVEGPVAISIAISLKRIADALSGVGHNILTAPINSYGEGIGEAIQGQFERGQR